MSPEEQRIAIAEVCGWKTGYRDPEAWHPLPDYPNDLNAMHDAEKTLDRNQLERYADILCDEFYDGFDPDIVAVITATAAQRAEAFLKTLNLWKE